MLFNMVVDSIIQHWVTVVAEKKSGTEVLGLLIQDLTEHFYANNSLVVSTQPNMLQQAFGVLVGLFYRVGLRPNTRKRESISCQPRHTLVRMSVEEYKRLTMGTGTTSR